MTNRRINYRAIWFRSLAVFTAVFLFTVFLNLRQKDEINVDAASLAKFNPGYIISDYQMGRYDAMTEAEIQKFLTNKNSCNNKDEAQYKSLSAANPNVKWHFEDGHFVCLSEELFGDGEVIGEGETAAHIIYKAAQDYKINPQVLIVLLQKETGLITDTIPNNADYRKATGYGCPDTAACSEKYYGFKNQVRHAAALFAEVLNGGWTNYPVGNNYIQYNPSASCGGSTVNIKNLATSALYRYTPYQPNAAALAAGYGEASCGAYGNRNFYLYFEDWFGGIVDEAKSDTTTATSERIQDGWYQIYSKVYSTKVIDIEGGVKKNMTLGKTLVFERNAGATENEIFQLKYNEKTGYYNIINPASGLYLDVEGGSTNNSTPLIVFKKNSSCNQDFKIQRDKEGYVTFVSRCSDKVLDATSDGRLVIYTGHGGDNQKWLLKAVQEEGKIVKSGIYQITSGNKALDISGGVKSGMTSGEVIAFAKANQDNQKFEMLYDLDKKVYRIQNPASGLYLMAGANITVTKQNNSCTQEWVFAKSGNGYELRSACDRTGILMKDATVSLTTTGLTSVVLEKKAEATNKVNLSEDKSYQIKIGKNSVDIYGGIKSGMTMGDLIMFESRTSENDNQVFKFKYDASKDAYYIYNAKSGLRLDVEESGVKDNSKVIGFKDNGGYCNQFWEIEKKGEGYIIKSSCSGKLLTISNSLLGGSSRIAIYSANTKLSQTWTISEV